MKYLWPVYLFVYSFSFFHVEPCAIVHPRFCLVCIFSINIVIVLFLSYNSTEWQKAIYSVGGSEMKQWPLQLRRSVPDGMPSSTNGASLQQQQEISLIQERALPSSPSPLYSPHSKASGFMKGGLGQPVGRKQLIGGHTMVDNSRGLLQWVQSISFVAISIDHSLHLVHQADSPSSGEFSVFPFL